ncbi:hypothetical protein C8D88_1011283 [Lentzea atacamensis]|uniref:Uncharacterized protein n=1 Tax=Lentzea atacamensis TaxID=531938 RepID=A0A316IE33_9PSEU|nr:hypothetical protein [Lentzea atacamensis]PWK91249.1 hypothetical protein C8D88_1011283 [Lentzea atacamensis]
MAITRWARRAVLTATALAFTLPFSTGTAQADPIIEALGDNNVNVAVGAYNNNVNSIPVSLGAGVSLNTGSGIPLGTNEGIQLALDIAHAPVWADAGVDVPFTNIAAAVDAPAVAVAAPQAEVAAPPAPEAAPAFESAVTITDDTVLADDTSTAADQPKGDEEEDSPEEVEPSG